jgi:hypothetical protein
VLECIQRNWWKQHQLGFVLRMQKRTFCRVCWNSDNGPCKNTMNWSLVEGCKRERSLKNVGTQSKELFITQQIGPWIKDAKREQSLKYVGTQSIELLTTQRVGGYLRVAKGDGLWKMLERSQRSCL